MTSISTVQSALTKQTTTTTQIVSQYLKNIESTEELNIYVEVFGEDALAQAAQLDAKIAANEPLGKLFGLVVSIKDVICYAGKGVTAASKILENYESPFSATVVERLLAEDAIIIGRTNCDEFAMGSSNETSIYGPTKNAADTSKVPGGSSGASAVSVQADTCLVALGSDTGGSVRQPASFCGLVGLKATYGRISRWGLLAYGSSFDGIGIFAKNTEDAALVLSVIAGEDEKDATSSPEVVDDFSVFKNKNFNKKIKIAYLKPSVDNEGIDPEIKANILNKINQLQKAGHEVEGVDFDLLDYVIPTYYVLTTAEASSNLSRYDGVHFGYRAENTNSLEEVYTKTRTEGFGTEVKRRILLGTFVLSAGYYDAYYTKAQKVRRLIQERLESILSEYDFILSPTSPILPWTLGEKMQDPIAMYLADIYTVTANLAGIPAVSIPTGTSASGLPIGMQLMGKKYSEMDLLAFGKEL